MGVLVAELVAYAKLTSYPNDDAVFGLTIYVSEALTSRAAVLPLSTRNGNAL